MAMPYDARKNGRSVFEALARRGIRKVSQIDRVVMIEWSLTKLNDLSREIVSHDSKMTFRGGASPFSFVLGKRMVGGRGGCDCVDCRAERLRSTTVFSALYAERVFMVDPFWNHWHLVNEDGDPNREFGLRYQYASDLKALFAMKPLFDAGIADLVTPGIATTAAGSRRLALPVTRGRIAQAARRLERQYTARSVAEIGESGLVLGPALNVSAPPELEEMVFSMPAPGWVLRREQTKKLSTSDLARLRPLRSMFEFATDDLVFQYVMSVALGTSYLTDRSLDVAILNATLGPSEARANALLAKDLICSLPVIANVPLKKLLAVRRQEHDSFVIYRNAITKAIAEAGHGKHSSRAVAQIRDDVVEPELARLQLQIRRLRTGPLFRAVQDAIIVSGLMTIGVVGHVFPSAISQIVAAAGGVAVARELASKSFARLRVPDEVKEDKFYFLWRLGLRSRSRS